MCFERAGDTTWEILAKTILPRGVMATSMWREKSVDEKYKDREKRHRDKNKEKEKEKNIKERERKKEREERDRERERKRKVSRRKEDSVENGGVKKVDESVADKKETRTREEDMAKEQRKLDDEMEKRRRRVQEWESDDEEALPVENTNDHIDVDGDVKENNENEDGMVNGLDNGDTVTFVQNGDAMVEDEIDPHDAFMNTMVILEVTKLTAEVFVLDEKNSDNKVKENGRKKTRENGGEGLVQVGGKIGRSNSRFERGEEDREEFRALLHN
uniref:Uncharacterized protein n=1 Tax=Tanacetum cinerariifolium TaxID=118510 RepID=A0A6L2J984_TANCI|nr:hypothetical protein [Tanacetum cinerariifolium]